MRFPRLSWQSPVDRSPLAELVDAHAEALMRGTPGLDALLARYDQATAAEARDLFALAERVSQTLVPVRPDDRFARTLYEQLRAAEVPAASLVERLRRLPPRTQLAAAGIGGAATLTVTAGVVWIAWRSEGGLLGALRRRIPAA